MAVGQLAGKLDKATKSMFHIYLQRKCRALDRLLASYIKPDGSSVGVPPELKDVSPPCAQVLQLVVSIQAEVFTYARYVERLFGV